MLEDFIEYIEKNHLIRKGDRILAAVSGGIDSMVMTDLLLRSGNIAGIAHCNFSLRGKESEGDEKMVREYSAKHKIQFFSFKFKTGEYAKSKGISVEMAARELRYEWFEKIRKENRFDSVAVAHNLNDNIETVILNLIRGTGISGLTGIRPSSNKIIRPLLFATRQSIELYSAKHGIGFREDMTNSDTRITRNKIRHKIIPMMKEINPSVEKTLNETSERLNGINQIVCEYITDLRIQMFRKTGSSTLVQIKDLGNYMHNRSLIFELFKPYGISGSLVDDLMKIIKGRTGGQVFSDTHRFLKNRDELIISGADTMNDERSFSTPEDLGRSELVDSVKCIALKADFTIDPDSRTAYLDHSRISFPITIRRWRTGDYFYPFGMTGKKKVSDYFIDRKFSRIAKDKAMILESDGRIVWIIGERIDNRFRITKSTRKALIIKARPASASDSAGKAGKIRLQ